MRANKLLAAAAGAATVLGALAWQPANAAVEIGILNCNAVPGTRQSLLVRSTVDVKCTFKHKSGNVLKFKGETGVALGVDLSKRKQQEFAFSVLATTDSEVATAQTMSGRYGGATASAVVGVGVGAKVLVGGSEHQFALNPLAIETSRGFGAAAGLGFLYIEPDE